MGYFGKKNYLYQDNKHIQYVKYMHTTFMAKL